MLSFSTLFLRAANSTLEAGHASAVTIGYRLPMLAALSLWPQPETLGEAQLMVTEKFAAAAEGAVAATGQAAALSMLMMFGRTDAEDFASAMMSIAVAASEPAHGYARANAERLSKSGTATPAE
ncbi:hypothetical protein [Labrys monachus]|uniref:Antifreeze protein n=1 Tax=Labrys monachus TaxID=217067 RepID=A0ABU0FKB4_9HYPH|nr:hypothetical protein [Labrys monachus]MDQ0395053.1 hypothetical protein [Labrys monachus]